MGLCLRASTPEVMEVWLDEALARKAAEIPFAASDGWQRVSGAFHALRGKFPLYSRLRCEGRISD